MNYQIPSLTLLHAWIVEARDCCSIPVALLQQINEAASILQSVGHLPVETALYIQDLNQPEPPVCPVCGNQWGPCPCDMDIDTVWLMLLDSSGDRDGDL